MPKIKYTDAPAFKAQLFWHFDMVFGNFVPLRYSHSNMAAKIPLLV